MRAGTMRDKITFERWDSTPDPRWGASAGGWSAFVTIWASVDPVAGMEKFQGQAVQGETTHVIRSRFHPDVNAQSRIRYRSAILDIISVIDVEGLNAELLIQAKEYPAEGGADV